MATELRTVHAKIELRKVGNKTFISGFAARYNVLSQDLGGFREQIAHGAFASAIRRKDDVRMCFNHDANQVVGRTKSGTLGIMEKCDGGAHQNCGLWFECVLPETQLARDLAASITRGDIDACSFAFKVPEGGDVWDQGTDENGQKFPRRTLKDINPLVDCSVVTYPAYNVGTSVSVDSYEVSSMNSVPANVLAEARSRGGYRPAPPAPVVLMTEKEKAELRGKRIADDDHTAYLLDVNESNRPKEIDPLTVVIRKFERKINNAKQR